MPLRHDPLSRRGFLLASASAVLVSACAANPDAVGKPSRFGGQSMAGLLAAQAVPVRSLTAGDPGVLALAKRLSKSRMAGLGEATHGSHEDALLKSAVIQAMVENHDLRVILLEANRSGTAQLNAYASASRTGLLATEALRNAPVFSIVKTEVMADLLTWLRGWNAVNSDRPVRVVGVDCQASSADAGTAYESLLGVRASVAVGLRPALGPLLTEASRKLRHDLMLKQLTTAQRLAAEAACRTMESELNGAGLADAAFNARRAWQGLSAFEHETSDGDLSRATPEYWSRRDLYMAENAIALSRDERSVFWGHNLHVIGGRPDGGGTGYVPSGAVLRERLGADYAVLVQDFGEARFLAIPAGSESLPPDAAPVEISRSTRPGTLNALLASATRQSAWFDLAGLPENNVINAWRRTPIGLDWYGASASLEPVPADITTVAPGTLFDVLVFHPALTPSRML